MCVCLCGMEEETITKKELEGKIKRLEDAVDKLKVSGKPFFNAVVTAKICRMLGITDKKPGQGISYMTYEEGFGPTLTLLDVDFGKAPGYVVWSKGLSREKGKEPGRRGGDVWINKFPSQKKVLSIPYFMLSEQVAQIMRFLKLPSEFVVSLNSAKPKDPMDKDVVMKSLFRFPSNKDVLTAEQQFGKGFKLALKDRHDQSITMLPLHNNAVSRSQGRRRNLNKTKRPLGNDEELVPRLETGGVLSQAFQKMLDATSQQEVDKGGDVIVSNSNGSVSSESLGGRGRKRKERSEVVEKEKGEKRKEGENEEVEEEEEEIKDLGIGRIGSSEFLLDINEAGDIVFNAKSLSPESPLYINESDDLSNGTSFLFPADDFDWENI